MRRDDGHAVQRPPVALAVGLVLALAGMFLAGLPTAAQADELPHNFDVEAACQPGEVPASGFQDSPNTTHGPSIECLYWYGLTRGVTPTEYRPTNPIQRGHAATFLTNLLEEVEGLTMPAPDEGAFTDIDGTTHEDNIEQLAGFDPPILRGYPDGTFRPNQFIQRDQFATIIDAALARIASEVDDFAPLPAGEVGQFDDVPAGNTHSEAIERLADAEILLGRTQDEYFPHATLERGQSATIIARVLGGLVYIGQVDRPADAADQTVSGVIHDATHAQPGEVEDPINDATLEIRGDGARTITTGSDGQYSVELPPGNYTFTVTAAGFIPHQQHVEVDDSALDVEFRMYRTAEVPADDDIAGPSQAVVANVDVQEHFWVIPLIIGGNEINVSEAQNIVLSRPDGVILELGAADTNRSWWNHDGNFTSNRGGDQAGDHVVYYEFDGHDDVADGWYTLTATFDGDGTLIAVNGDDCAGTQCVTLSN